jgi:hypothetical protein
MASQQPECCKLQICNNLLQEVMDMPTRVFCNSFWLLSCETSLQSPGMTSQQQECCILHICNNELQEVMDMPARVFSSSILASLSPKILLEEKKIAH